jgi:hypothetical protein
MKEEGTDGGGLMRVQYVEGGFSLFISFVFPLLADLTLPLPYGRKGEWVNGRVKEAGGGGGGDLEEEEEEEEEEEDFE